MASFRGRRTFARVEETPDWMQSKIKPSNMPAEREDGDIQHQPCIRPFRAAGSVRCPIQATRAACVPLAKRKTTSLAIVPHAEGRKGIPGCMAPAEMKESANKREEGSIFTALVISGGSGSRTIVRTSCKSLFDNHRPNVVL